MPIRETRVPAKKIGNGSGNVSDNLIMPCCSLSRPRDSRRVSENSIPMLTLLIPLKMTTGWLQSRPDLLPWRLLDFPVSCIFGYRRRIPNFIRIRGGVPTAGKLRGRNKIGSNEIRRDYVSLKTPENFLLFRFRLPSVKEWIPTAIILAGLILKEVNWMDSRLTRSREPDRTRHGRRLPFPEPDPWSAVACNILHAGRPPGCWLVSWSGQHDLAWPSSNWTKRLMAYLAGEYLHALLHG